MAAADFIKSLVPGAQKVRKKYNVLASLVIAQGCLESGFGTSGLSKQAYNLFGIKGTYNGKYVLMWTSEQDKYGNVERVQAKFRKYPSYAESLADLGSLYNRLDRYKAVVGETDYKKACRAVQKAGYATDINYANKLITMIEQYKLMQYDDASELPNEPDDPESPETPEEEPSFPSKEYAGNDIPLNKKLPSDVDFPQLHVSTKDGNDVVEVTGVIVDLTDDTTGKKSFTFTITKTESNATEFDLLVNDNILYIDERRFKQQKYYITDVDLKQAKNVLTKTITANHIFTVLLAENRVDDTVTKKLTVKGAFDIALKGTDFSYVLEEPESKFATSEEENFGDKNSTELIDQLINDYELELDVDNYKIHVYKKMGKEIPFTFDSRYNMPGISIKTNSQNCSTRAWGYGAMSKDSKSTDKKPKYVFEPILYIHPEEKKFLREGKPKWADPIRDETIKKSGSMVSALKKHVNPYPETVVSVDYQYVYEPKLLKIEKPFWKGDTVHILADTADGTTYEDDVRLLTIQYNPLNPYSSPKLTFANFRKDIQDIAVNQAKKLREQKRYIDQILTAL